MKHVCTYFLSSLFSFGLSISLLTGVSVAETPSIEEFLSRKSSFIGVALEGFPLRRQDLVNVQNEQGSVGDLLMFYLQWPILPSEGFFPWESFKLTEEFGATPVITWEPRYFVTSTADAVPYERILAGVYDDYIVEFAKAAALYRKPLFIRLAHEMNLVGYHWGTTLEEYGPKSPEIYQKMFRHIVTLFRQVGATNVYWVFCPNNESVPIPRTSTGENLWNRIANYYPGDEYVDVFGLDGFNWGTSRNREEHGWDSSWKTFEQLFTASVNELRAINSEKEILIFETGVVEEGGDKQAWLNDTLEKRESMGLKGILWFLANKENNWSLPPQFISQNMQ